MLWVVLAAGLGSGVVLASWLVSSALPPDSSGRSPSSASTPQASRTVVPTRVAMVVPPVVPTAAAPSRPAEPRSSPGPDDPYRLSIGGRRAADTKASTREAEIIAVGTIKQVLPARWTTADGRRPDNPHARGNLETIFRPVVMNVEQCLVGEHSQSELVMFAFGGTVGQDSVEATISDIYEFDEGQRVIVFLVDKGLTVGGTHLWTIIERYTLTPEGQATNSLRTAPLGELLAEIEAARIR